MKKPVSADKNSHDKTVYDNRQTANTTKTKKAPQGTMKKVLNYIKHYRFLMLLSVILAATTVSGTLYIPILVGNSIDMIIARGQVDFNSLIPILVEIAVIAAVMSLLQWVMNTINNRITYHVVRDIRDDAFRKIQVLPFKYLNSHPSGETVSRVISDADQFADGLLMGFTQLFTGIITIAGTLGFMIYINWKIALVVVVLTPLSLFVARFIAKKTYSMFKVQSETRGEQTSLIDEVVSNQKVVKAFSHEKEIIEEFDNVNERLKRCSLRATFFSSITNPATRFVNSVVYAFVALTGALAALDIAFAVGSTVFTVGNLSSFLSYANQYTKPFNEISGVVTEMQNALACAARIFELIEEESQIPDKENALELKIINGNVELKNVDFSYSKDKKLIENLNLNIKPGQRIAIVGPTGCGKTTIINLLMRFYDVDSGQINVENEDIRDVTRKSLRTSYGMVLQDTWLRTGTIRENIAMGRPDSTDDEIIDAAKASHAHSFIKQLPQGYDTVIGEDGGSLSQGQKQLLCIARVMLTKPKMLILDEATSSIDTRTEIRIQKAFLHLMEGKTTFIVAHRLSTIRETDVILVMKDGHIIEQGNHKELLSAGGFYKELYCSQFEN